MKNKIARQNLILELISKRRIQSQEELSKLLEKSDVYVTQATLSRDLKELQLIKISDADGYYYHQQSSNSYRITAVNRSGHIVDGVKTIQFAGNLGIIKTEPGFANVISSIIDKGIFIKNILGTVSGDDTLLVVFKKEDEWASVLKGLEEILPGISLKLLK